MACARRIGLRDTRPPAACQTDNFPAALVPRGGEYPLTANSPILTAKLVKLPIDKT